MKITVFFWENFAAMKDFVEKVFQNFKLFILIEPGNVDNSNCQNQCEIM